MPSDNILINPSEIALSDRSVQYGDASFTTMYCENGAIALFNRHLLRLQAACDCLDIHFNDWATLQATLSTVASERDAPSVIKVLITRGSGGRAYEAPQSQTPRCIITTHDAGAMHNASPVNCVKLSTIRLPSHSGLNGVKHTNRLAQVMAKTQAHALQCDEVLMCDEEQHVIEASSANIFYCLNGAWHTPPLDLYGVQGVMRDAFIDYLSINDIHVNIASHHLSQFKKAEHILLSNAVKGIRPVKCLEMDRKIMLNTELSGLIKPFIKRVLDSSEFMQACDKAQL